MSQASETADALAQGLSFDACRLDWLEHAVEARGGVLGAEPLAGLGEVGALHLVLELAHVPGPAVGEKERVA